MPRIRIGQEAATGTLQQTITDRVKAGKVVPIISNLVSNDLVLGQGQHQKLVQAYAEHVRYNPEIMAGSLKLPQITQYVSIVRDQVPDPVAAKELYLKFVTLFLNKQSTFLFDSRQQEAFLFLNPVFHQEIGT